MPAISWKDHRPIPWDKMKSSAFTCAPMNTAYHKAASLIAANGDKVSLNTHIIFWTSPNDKVHVHCSYSLELLLNQLWFQPIIGFANKILVPVTLPRIATHIAVQEFKFLDSLHPQHLLPCLRKSENNIVIQVEVCGLIIPVKINEIINLVYLACLVQCKFATWSHYFRLSQDLENFCTPGMIWNY